MYSRKKTDIEERFDLPFIASLGSKKWEIVGLGSLGDITYVLGFFAFVFLLMV